MQTVLSQKWAGLSFYSGALLAHAFFSVERGFLIGPETRDQSDSKFEIRYAILQCYATVHVTRWRLVLGDAGSPA